MKRQITATRREIVTLLRRFGPQTVVELAARMGITPVGVRKHLDVLEIDGYVTSVTQRRPLGRPVQVYSLTSAADDLFPTAYDTVLISVLRQVVRIGGQDLLEKIVDGRREEMEADYQSRLAGAVTLDERVARLAQARSEDGYMADLEYADGTYIIREHNCAVCRVSREYPIFCEAELRLIRNVLGPGVAVERTEHRAAGAPTCTYVVRAS